MYSAANLKNSLSEADGASIAIALTGCALAQLLPPAMKAVAKAIKRGELLPLKGAVRCVDCGGRAAVYDHREYGLPLNVDPVCKGCNTRRGPAKETAPLIEARETLRIHARLRRLA